ncbi:MAG: hypothetical protein J0I08_00545 [Rhizobiales bacterium]|nr:hypothetical protein [Hyphomicrobiales bacterium]
MSGRSNLTHEDVLRILQIVDKSEDVEISVEYGGLKLHVSKGAAAGRGAASTPLEHALPKQVARPLLTSNEASDDDLPSATSTPLAQPTSETASSGDAIPAGALAIIAPLLGRFYRSSSPTEPPLVEVGSKISEDDTVGVVEVMKLFNEIKSGLSGTVIEIRAANEEMVEEGQVLFVVRPD